MMNRILELLIQTGIGSIIGVLIGMFFQYLISKKLKIFETKLIIFRRVYKQLKFLIIMHEEDISTLEKHSGIQVMNAAEKSGLDLKKDLGDILYYVDGELEKMIEALIYSLYKESAVMGKSDFDNILKIMSKLKKLI